MAHHMFHQLGLHLLYGGEAMAILALLRGPGNRRRGLPFFGGWFQVARFMAVYIVAVAGWEALPWAWRMAVAGVFILVCMGLLFREALRQGTPQRDPGTKAGSGAA